MDCVGDESVAMLGSAGAGYSPRNLKITTIGDMLRLKTGNRAKVVSISNKERVAILMGGKTGTAYWTEDSVVVSSTYYMKSLPPYISAYNSSGIFQRYYGRTWTETMPAAAAKICDIDSAWYELPWAGLGRTFPRRITGNDTSRITPSYYSALGGTPFSTEILLELARSSVAAESLGTRGVTDMLCVGISATDIIGHSFGPNSHEVFDNVLQTDSLLASFFSFLNAKVGLDNCVIALSSDHGIAPIPEYHRKIFPATDAGRITSSEISAIANRVLGNCLSAGQRVPQWVEKVVDCSIYLNAAYIDSQQIPLDSVMHILRDSLRSIHPFAAAYSRDQILHGTTLDVLGRRVALSYYAPRSGDVMVVLKPFYVTGSDGTNHGQPYDYDTHVPLILAGKGIRPGVYTTEVSPVDIAPTLCAFLELEFPANREGKILREIVR